MTGSKDDTCEPDLDRLAESWITLWQGELVALATDPEVASAWRQAFGLGAAWLRAAQAQPGEPPVDRGADSPRAAAAGAASGDGAGDPLGGADPAGLRARLDELERRVATLERGAKGGGAGRRSPRRKQPPA